MKKKLQKISLKLTPPLLLLEKLVNTSSGTSNVQGVNQVQDILAFELKKLGFEVKLFENPKQSLNSSGHSSNSGRFLVGTRQKSSAPFINLVMHADTVFEDHTFQRFNADLKRGIAVGSGVIDDKGGIVVALEGIKGFLETSPRSQLNLRVVCSSCEETGSPGFHPLLTQLGAEAWMVLGFEPSLENGSIIKSRAGNRWYQLHVHGKSAHAGRDHSKGIDAGFELAHKLTRLYALTDYKNHVSVSVGQIKGGHKYNIICGQAEAKIDTRFRNLESLNKVHNKIIKIIEHPFIRKNALGEHPQSSWKIVDDCPPFSDHPKSRRFLKKYQSIIRDLENRSVGADQAGGAADSNYMNRAGLIVIDGLGPTGGGMHQAAEFLNIDSINTRAQALTEFLRFVSKE